MIYNTHLVPLQLKGLKLHGDAILSGGDHLPHAVLVGRILFGPARRADGAVQLGEEAAAGRWTHTQTVGRAKHAITASPLCVQEQQSPERNRKLWWLSQRRSAL